MTHPLCMRLCPCLFVIIALPGSVAAQAPVHQRIDELIAAGKPEFAKQAAGSADDAEFLRRVHLDLAGVIPSADVARAFLKDTAADRRVKLIDRLLASEPYPRHMQRVFDNLFMDRRPDKHVKHGEWQEYLRKSFADNKPLDQLVREILSADGADVKNRAPARFYLDRDAEPHQLTRDIGRLFLGMNVHCAQCHDHPLVPAYRQEHYYGIYAFLSRTALFTDKKAKLSMLAEKAEGEVSFQSVFVPKVTKNSGPRLPDGPVLQEPKQEKGKEYAVAPAKDVRPVPRYSRRALLAEQIIGNAHFRRTLANRLWFQMLGRGIVHPVEYDHEANPPSHPELLKFLGAELAARKFDVKFLLREIALSKTYQRSSVLPKGGEEAPENTFSAALLRPMSPEQLAWSVMQATGLADAERQTQGKKPNEAALHARLVGNEVPFIALFGNAPGEPASEFQATLDQTLFLRNGDLVRGWLAPRSGNLTFRLARLASADAVAEELYLSVLTRLPTVDERREVADFLASRGSDRPAALQDLAWALLATAEFRFNH